MKKILISGITLLTVLSSCQEKKEEKTAVVDYAVISGKTQQGLGAIALVYNNQLVKEILVKEDGTFRDTLRDLGDNHFYHLYANRISSPVFLQNGTNIEINFEDDITKAQFAGADAQKTQYLSERNNFLATRLDGSDNNLFGQKPQEFKENLKTIFNELKDKLKSYAFDDNFTQNQEKWLDYKFISYLEKYPEFNSYLSGISQILPDGFLSEKANINFDNADDYKNIDAYRELVQADLIKDIPDIQSPTKEQIAGIIEKAKTLKSANIRTDIAKNLTSLMGIGNEMNDIIATYINQFTDDQELKNSANEVVEASKKLAVGSVSPSFSNYENINGKKSSLSDFKGKVLYLDIWATWCGPCRQEIPFLKELEQKFHGKNIEFISISIDDIEDAAKWRSFVKENDLKGVQLMADNAWNSQFAVDYLIHSIPRFIIIDKEGNIVSADAPRPSNPKTESLLRDLL